MNDYRALVASSDDALSRVDALIMNLLVAKSISSLAHLDIPSYVSLCDSWAEQIGQRLSRVEARFWQSPQDWETAFAFFRLGVVCGFLEHDADIAYKEDQRTVQSVLYTDPSDLFLNGVLDTRRGTCGNMAALHVAIAWRFGWPVSLAWVKSHFVCRYDDGNVTYNIESTQAGYGGFKSDPDVWLIREYQLPPIAITSGSDLRALKPREMLGAFIGLRGRHARDSGRHEEAELDYLLARCLYPTSRRLYIDSMALTVGRGPKLFAPGEIGSPDMLPHLVRELEHEKMVPVFARSEQTVQDAFFRNLSLQLEV
jgi:hypothetical protein